MLSSRDYDDFTAMFKAFGLVERIRYGTFDTLCEKLLRESYGDLRQSTSDFISQGKSTRQPKPAACKRVLIIDEVDVFCSEVLYPPLANHVPLRPNSEHGPA